MKKFLIVLLIFVLFVVACSATYASNMWWSKANTFFAGTDWKAKDSIFSDLLDILRVLGNAVFIIVAIVLGIKYMLGSAEGKADIKDGLFSLTVAMVLFYGCGALRDIFVQSKKLVFIDDNSPEITIANIYETVVYCLNFTAIAAVAYVGIKYLLSGAEGKAELKGKGVPFIVGMILTFSTLTFLNFIMNIINDVL